MRRGEVPNERWYSYTPDTLFDPKARNEATDELLDLYRAAVRRHLLSDVPVGILLSGGLDSGLLLALMNEQGGPWPAYTIGYGASYGDDELADAKETAASRRSPYPGDTRSAEFERSLPKIVECLEEPVAASSIVPMYFVSQRARQDVKVALIGQGPDELFGGYKRHMGVHYGESWRGLPAGLRSIVGSAVNGLPRNETLKRGVRSLGSEDRLTRYQDVFSWRRRRPSTGFSGRFLPERQGHELVEYWDALRPQMEQTDELGGFQLLEIRSSLPDELSCTRTSSPWLTASKRACLTSIAPWLNTFNGSMPVSRFVMGPENGFIGRFAGHISRHAFSNERSVASR